jgi:hypothetical protein
MEGFRIEQEGVTGSNEGSGLELWKGEEATIAHAWHQMPG